MAHDNPSPGTDKLVGQHIAAARQRIAHLAGLEAGTQAAERRIAEAAQKRLEAVDADLAKLRGPAQLDDTARDRFLALTEERGRLHDVMGRAQSALAAP
jgi:hypothetical protein